MTLGHFPKSEVHPQRINMCHQWADAKEKIKYLTYSKVSHRNEILKNDSSNCRIMLPCHIRQWLLILWPPDGKSQQIGKDPDAGKDWDQEEKGETEDETTGWYHWLNGLEFEQTLLDSEGQGSLGCCSPWGCKNQTWLSDQTTTTT